MQARAEALPFDPSSFDIVVSTLIFHHLPTEIKKQAMRETHRVLRTGGRFLLADFAKPQGLVLTVVFAFATLIGSDEIKYLQDNKTGKLPLFLEEAGFAVQELPPR
jgi:ubiquinone/menaquinone biosynthesis C-methylase UbiE